MQLIFRRTAEVVSKEPCDIAVERTATYPRMLLSSAASSTAVGFVRHEARSPN
jgi:hypothetical protein